MTSSVICRYDGIEDLRDAHGHELAQRIGIVCIYGHDVAVRMRIEIADGQRLHFRKHIVTHMAQKALRHDRHRLVVKHRRTERDDIHKPHAADDVEHAVGNIRPSGAAVRQRRDDLRKDEAQKHG